MVHSVGIYITKQKHVLNKVYIIWNTTMINWKVETNWIMYMYTTSSKKRILFPWLLNESICTTDIGNIKTFLPNYSHWTWKHFHQRYITFSIRAVTRMENENQVKVSFNFLNKSSQFHFYEDTVKVVNLVLMSIKVWNQHIETLVHSHRSGMTTKQYIDHSNN